MSADPRVPARPTTPPPPPPAPRRGTIVVRVECAHGQPGQTRGTLPDDEVERLADVLAWHTRPAIVERLRALIITVDTL